MLMQHEFCYVNLIGEVEEHGKKTNNTQDDAKIAVVFQELLPYIATESCPNPSCRTIRTSKFLYLNNLNIAQPR